MKRNQKQNRILASAMALGLIATMGCGHAPMAPQVDTQGTTVEGGGMAAKIGAESSGLQPPYYAPEPVEPTSSEHAVQVQGAKGAKIKVDNVTVNIPKLAFLGKADIIVTPDPAKLQVKLDIRPASKNHFNKPVVLEFDTRACGEDMRYMQILWFDAEINEWVQIPSVADPVAGTVTAQLSHFSEYKAECGVKKRSGW